MNDELTLRFFLRSCPDPVCFLSRDGEIIDMNLPFADLFERAVEELQGTRFETLVHEDDRQIVKRICEGGHALSAQEWEFRLCPKLVKQGSAALWYATSDSNNNLLLFGRVRNELQRQIDLMAQTNKLARVGGWELDLRTNELYWTPQTYLIHEVSALEYTPTVDHAIELYAPSSRALIRSAVEAAATDGTPFELQLELDTFKGNRVSVISQGVAVYERGEIVKLCGACQEVSALKEVHLERDRLRMQLLQAQKMEAMGTLAAGAAHDFNNVLTAIIGYTESIKLLAGTGTSVGRAIEGIEQALTEAIGLTRGLLTFGRVSEVDKSELAVEEIISESLFLIRPILGSSIDLVIEREESRDAWVYADIAQIQQVLLNLVINARDAMPDGGLLRIRTRILAAGSEELDVFELSDVSPAGYLGLEVHDTGEGVPEDIRMKIFNPFFTTKARGKGTGLGLSIVHGVLTDHGGGIVVREGSPKGTCFLLILPLTPMDEIGHSDFIENPDDHETLPGTGMVVLAEENAQIRGILSHALEQKGYRVFTAASSDALCEEVLKLGELPVMCVFDCGMSDSSGLELLRRIRAEVGLVPAILMSGTREIGAEDLPNVEFMAKPFSVASFLSKVGALLSGAS
jgi:signal transduction histidine kinase/CheY-like chemotaxis protein